MNRLSLLVALFVPALAGAAPATQGGNDALITGGIIATLGAALTYLVKRLVDRYDVRLQDVNKRLEGIAATVTTIHATQSALSERYRSLEANLKGLREEHEEAEKKEADHYERITRQLLELEKTLAAFRPPSPPPLPNLPTGPTIPAGPIKR